MFIALQVLAVLVVAQAFSTNVAHALEYPGKLRLSREQYFGVQPIYYPGFTISGVSEPVGMLLLAVLAIMTPFGTAAFWLTVGAFAALIAVHVVYWVMTHPVNDFWLSETKLSAASKRFFSAGGHVAGTADWTALRDRWEYSHIARALLAFVSLLLLVIAIATADLWRTFPRPTSNRVV